MSAPRLARLLALAGPTAQDRFALQLRRDGHTWFEVAAIAGYTGGRKARAGARRAEGGTR